MFKLFVHLLVCQVILLITSCATNTPVERPNKVSNWLVHRDKAAELDTWQLKGRIVLQNGKKAWSASLRWQQRPKSYSLQIIAPLGQGTIELNGDNNFVQMRTAEDKIIQAVDVATLLQHSLGWQVPVSSLNHWIRGIPDPDGKTDNMLLDDKGRITDMSQTDWEISYKRYVKRGGFELPSNIQVQNEKLKLKLVIHSWEI